MRKLQEVGQVLLGDLLRANSTTMNNGDWGLKAPLNNVVKAAAFRKVTVQGATLKAWRVTSKSSNTEMLFS
jgi:hypothetical protein